MVFLYIFKIGKLIYYLNFFVKIYFWLYCILYFKIDLLKILEGKIAKWWTPDDVVFVDKIPLTATGKMQKLKLRELFKDYKLPTL